MRHESWTDSHVTVSAEFRRSFWGVFTLFIFLLFSLSSLAWAQCDPSICVGSSACTIAGVHALPDGCDLDFGAKDVTIAKNAILKAQGGSFSIEAHNLTLLGALQTRGLGSGFSAGSISLTLSGDFIVPKGAQGQILSQASGLERGGIIAITADGAVSLQGNARLSSRLNGTIEIIGRSVLIAQPLASFNFVQIRSTNGPITVDKPIHVDTAIHHLDCGGTVDMRAHGGDLTLNALVSQTNICGSGSLDFAATGNIVVNAPINATDKAPAMGAGDGGGRVSMRAQGDITLSSRASIITNGTGGSSDSPGGEVVLIAGGNVTVDAPITANGLHPDASGGCIQIGVGDNKTLRVNNELKAKSPLGYGGAIILGDAPPDLPYCGGSHDGLPVGADTIILSGRLDSSGPMGGENRITYRSTLNATGARLVSSVNSATTGNLIECGCVDLNPADGVCDSSNCLNNPIGLNPANVTPPAQIIPTALAP